MSNLKEAGCIIVIGPFATIERETLQCVHCQAHFDRYNYTSQKVRRGFCRNCMGPLCGAEKCGTCIPFEKKLDLYEAGKLAVLR